MGLIKAGMGALGGTLADQWKEFFYCDSLDKDVLMVKGQKRTSRRSSNNGEDNIITNGSGIAVADGQCMLIVEQGRVVEVCAEPGEFTFDALTPAHRDSRGITKLSIEAALLFLPTTHFKRRMPMDKDFMLHYFNKAVQPEWEELLKTPRYQPAASKRDAIAREFFRMLNDEQKRKYLDLESAVILAECDIAEALYMKGAADREMMIR